MSLTETEAFFAAYRDAFDRLDGDAVAALWHGASGIADAQDGCGRQTWWPDAAPMQANHRALCEVYRAAGYHHAEFTIERHVPMGPAHAFALLHWTLCRTDGGVLQRFHTGYQLMRTADGPRVLLAVAYQEDLRTLRGDPAH